MTRRFDREKVRSAFQSKADQYDRNIQVQRRVIDRFLEFVSGAGLTPRRVLDVGAGTGILAGALRRLYPDATMVCVDLAFAMNLAARDQLGGDGRVEILNADAERLPFAAGSFDLVVSTSTFQWLDTLDAAFSEVWRVLSPGGSFFLSMFGERTLFELKTSYRRALRANEPGARDRSHDFLPVAAVQAALERGGFASCSAVSELEVEYYPDVRTLLRSLKAIGAGNAAPDPLPGLGRRQTMFDMMEFYRVFFGNGSEVPASYDVIYSVGRKA